MSPESHSIAPTPAEDWRANNFDLIRLLAALQVALVHTIAGLELSGWNVAIVAAGLRLFPGVPIFFVLSGFLISASYERSDSIRDYYANRCLRIFPALWVCLVASVGVILIAGIGSVDAVSPLGWLSWWAAQMSLYQQYSPGFLRPWGVGGLNPTLWTIPVEFEFYLALPAIYAALHLRERRGDTSLLVLLAGSFAVHFVFFHPALFPGIAPYDFVLDTVVPYLWMFLVGVMIRRNWAVVRGWLVGRAHWWVLGYVLLCVASERLHIGGGSAAISPLFLLPLAGLVVSCAVSAPTLSDRILGRNDLSYGTYIYHTPVLKLMAQRGVQGDVTSAAAAIAISLCLAAGSWWFVERPFLRRKRYSLRATLVARAPASRAPAQSAQSLRSSSATRP